ncbi:MAG: DUF3592 domain-containing protein [Terriglobales bacterium]
MTRPDTLVMFTEVVAMDPQLQQSGIFVLFIFLGVLVERGWQWLRRRRALTWPVAEGRVHSADWRQPRTGTNRYFVGTLSYYYFVDGHFYSGYLRRSFSKADAAMDWTQRMHGAAIAVRYNAQLPSDSLLLEDEQQFPVSSHQVPVTDDPELVAAGD